MGQLYQSLVYQPILNTLVFLYNTIALQDFGVAIILLTILIRAILYPLYQKSVRHQLVMQHLQPKIKKIQDENPRNRQKQGEAMIALYKEHRVNPFSGIFFLIVQLPVLLAIFGILQNFNPETVSGLYPFVEAPQGFRALFLGLINLEQSNILIAGFAAVAQFFQGKMLLKKQPKPGANASPAEKIGRQMIYAGPALMVAFLLYLPSAVGLYWLTTSLFSIGQQALLNRALDHDEQLKRIREKPR